jgi:hypothetical protein
VGPAEPPPFDLATPNEATMNALIVRLVRDDRELPPLFEAIVAFDDALELQKWRARLVLYAVYELRMVHLLGSTNLQRIESLRRHLEQVFGTWVRTAAPQSLGIHFDMMKALLQRRVGEVHADGWPTLLEKGLSPNILPLVALGDPSMTVESLMPHLRAGISPEDVRKALDALECENLVYRMTLADGTALFRLTAAGSYYVQTWEARGYKPPAY